MTNIEHSRQINGEKPLAEEQLQPPQLRDLFLTATYNSTRSISPSVNTIALGEFGKEADEVIRLTESDSYHNEYLKQVLITQDRRVVVQRNATKGDPNYVESTILIYIDTNKLHMPRPLRQDKTIATQLHSHSIDTAPSALDIAGLLQDESCSHGEVAAFVSNPVRRLLVFRSPDTPMVSEEESIRLRDKWNTAAMQRADTFMRSARSQAELDSIASRISYALLRDIAKHYHLRVFSGFRNEKNVRLHNFK
jgi:hypothetical protein